MDLYLAPNPAIVELVRKQLLRDEEEARVCEAIRARVQGKPITGDRHSALLSHSGLNFEKLTPALLHAFNARIIHRALFDLQLGHAVKSTTVNQYTEVREARLAITEFICWQYESVPVSTLLGIWWDRTSDSETHSRSWVPRAVKNEPDFVALAEMWLEDSDSVQRWLDSFESTTAVVNNPTGRGHPVFSEFVAVAIVKFAEVRDPKMYHRRSLADACLQSQVRQLDMRRRKHFETMPTEFTVWCDLAGLFETRMPRFSQLFFHDF